MEVQRTGILTLALLLLGCLNYAFAEQDATVVDQSIHDIEDPNFQRFLRFLTKISEQDTKEDLHHAEDKTRRSITEENPKDETEFSERTVEPQSDATNAERAAAFKRLQEMLIQALELLEKENREEAATARPTVLPASLSVDSPQQNDGNVLREIVQLQNATGDEEGASKLPKRHLHHREQSLGEISLIPSLASAASTSAAVMSAAASAASAGSAGSAASAESAGSAASAASAASASSAASTVSTTSTASASSFALPVPLPLEALEELACDVESVGFGHSHALGVIVHEVFCEARKLWHYLLHALHNLKSEFSVGPQTNLAEAYASASSYSGFLERSPIILEELMKEPRHLLTLPGILKESVPLGSISKTLHRLKHAVHRFLHVAKELLLEKHHNSNLLQTVAELKNLGLLDQLSNSGISWSDIATATATATSSAGASPSTQNLLQAVKSMYDGYQASGFPEIMQTATAAASSASSTVSFVPAPAPVPAEILAPLELPVNPTEETVLEEQVPFVSPVVLPSSSTSSASSACVVEPAPEVISSSSAASSSSSVSSFAPLVNEGTSSSAASAASAVSSTPIRQRILNRIRPFITSISPVISSAASSSAASSSFVPEPMTPEVSVASSSSSASSVSIIEEPSPVEIEPVEEIAPIAEISPVAPEVVEEVISSSSAAASSSSSGPLGIIPEESVASAVASSTSTTGLANMLSQIRPIVAPLSNVLSVPIEEETLTSSLGSLKQKHGHKSHGHKQHTHYKQHTHHHKHHKEDSSPTTVVLEEVEVPVVISETPVSETANFYGGSPSNSAASAASAASLAAPSVAPSAGYIRNVGAVPQVSPGISSGSSASSASSASSGGSTSSSSSAASAASAAPAAAVPTGRRSSSRRLSLPLNLPREVVVNALGEDVLLPGDIVTVTMRNRNVLAGRVVDAYSPISLYLLQPKLSAAIFRSGGRVWSLVPSDFRDSTYVTLFDQY